MAFNNATTTSPSSTNSSSVIGGGRPRYPSAPPLSLVDTSHFNIPDGFWNHMADGGRRLRTKSRDIISIYLPVQWQPLFFDGLELLCNHVEKLTNSIRRRINWSSCGDDDNDNDDDDNDDGGRGVDDEEEGGEDTPSHSSSRILHRPSRSRSRRSASSIENKAARLALALTFGTLSFYLVYAVVLESLLEFFLPLYAAFSVSYWVLLWLKRRKLRIESADCFDHVDHQRRRHHHPHSTTTTDDSDNDDDDDDDDERAAAKFAHFRKLIFVCACLDLVLLLVHSAFKSRFIQTTVLHGLPVILLIFAERLFKRRDTTSATNRNRNERPEDDEEELLHNKDANSLRLSWLTSHACLLYVVRLFLCQGLTLVPFLARPYFGYLSTYLAFIGVQKRADTGFKSDISSALSKVSFCSNCVDRSGRSTTSGGASSNINQISFLNMPTTGRPSIKVHSSSTAEGTAAGEPSFQKPGVGRANRRISLPCGSLMPIKTQVRSVR